MRIQEIITKRNILGTLTIAGVYLVLSVYSANWSLVKEALFGDNSFSYTRDILWFLLVGIGSSMSAGSIALLIAIALLTGLNIMLLVQRFQSMKASGGIHLIAGGGSLLALVGSGCASCGLPILALIGLSGAVAYLPFGGMEISFLALGLLAVSIIILLRSSAKAEACVIKK